MDRSFIVQNDSERERLTVLVARLCDADLGRSLGEGWTVAASLAHLAFWDRFVLARWDQALRDELAVPSLDDRLTEMVNAAGLGGWRAVPGRQAARLAVDAAEALDRAIERLPVEAVRTARDRGQHRLLDRSEHRRVHLDEIEAVLPALS